MTIKLYVWAKRLQADVRGQDLIEYALMTGMVTLAVTSTLAPWVAPSISTIFSKLQSSLTAAGGS